MRTVILLTISNIFMTLAWYGHLKYKDTPLWIAILVSWGIAFVEYCFQVPANRIGHYDFTAAQLKTMQEVITLVVFCVFSLLYLREPLSRRLRHDGLRSLRDLQGVVKRGEDTHPAVIHSVPKKGQLVPLSKHLRFLPGVILEKY